MLDRAAKHALSDASTPGRLLAEGIMSYEQGAAADAATTLEEAIRLARPYARANPLVLVALARMRAATRRPGTARPWPARRRKRPGGSGGAAEPILSRGRSGREAARCRQVPGVGGDALGRRPPLGLREYNHLYAPLNGHRSHGQGTQRPERPAADLRDRPDDRVLPQRLLRYRRPATWAFTSSAPR